MKKNDIRTLTRLALLVAIELVDGLLTEFIMIA